MTRQAHWGPLRFRRTRNGGSATRIRTGYPAAEVVVESERLARDLAEHASELVAYIDVQGRYRYVNPAYARSQRRLREEIVGRSVDEVVSDWSWLQLKVPLRRALQGEQVRGSDSVMHTDGSISHLDVLFWPHRSASGVLGCVMIMTDVSERADAREALALAERRFQSLVQNSTDMIHALDAQGRVLYASPSTARILRYDPRALPPSAFALIDPEDTPRVAELWRQLVAQPGATRTAEYRMRRGDGQLIHVESIGTNLLEDPGLAAVILNSRDVTERKRHEQLERDRSRVLELIVDNAELDQVIDGLNQMIRNQLPEALAEFALPGDDLDEAPTLRLASKGNAQSGEHLIQLPAADPRQQELLDSAHQIAALAVTQRRLDYRLQHQAEHDSLTGLPNRNAFEARLAVELDQARRHGHQVGLIIIDLDAFKRVNDTLGHGPGDELLKQAARRLLERTRDSDLLARMGGDEFIVLVRELCDESKLLGIAARLRQTLNEPFHVGGYELFLSASVGVSSFPRDGNDGSTLLRSADAAMYRAKANGRDCVEAFRPEMLADALERLSLEAELRHAVAKNLLHLEYQPQIELATGRVIGIEALARWRHPKLGNVPPNRFIPLAEETGLIVRIGEWVLQEACAACQRLTGPGSEHVRMAVNVSAMQFARREFCDTVRDALSVSGLAPERLELEVTESVVMRGVTAVAERLAQLRQLGIAIAVDDFGTGYSSLAYLQELPVTSLKIDRSFVAKIGQAEQNTNGAGLVRSMVQLAHSLGLRVTAEGVETRQQAAWLRDSGCEEAQGWLYGRPVPLDQLRFDPKPLDG